MLGGSEGWNWSFRGYETLAGKRPVQEWFDGLPEEAKDEARDALAYLQHVPNSSWPSRYFEALGEGVSEVKLRVGKVRYRIYGYFGPSGRTRCYTFLHGTDKKVGHDRQGQDLAKGRKRQIEQGGARTHEFEFEGRPDSASA